MATPFPRSVPGGKSAVSLSASLLHQSTSLAARDNLFGANSKKRPVKVEVVDSKKKKKKDAKSADEAALNPVLGVGLGMTKVTSGNKVVKIDSLNYSKYCVGSLALGFVLHIAADCVTVSLPGGLTGTVTYAEVSDVTHKLVESKSKVRPRVEELLVVHQVVRCYVLEKGEGKHKTLSLSLRTSLVNRGLSFKHLSSGFPLTACVVSKEDHGFLLSGGVSSSVLFLPFKNVPNALGEIAIGQTVDCVVESLNESAHTAVLRAQRKAVVEAIARGGNLAFTSIVPGMMLNVTVDKIVENGLIVSFLNSFHGVVDRFSLPRLMNVKDWHACFRVGDVLQARIVFIDHGGKSARLSLRPHILELRVPNNLPELGSLIESMVVVASSKTVGVHLTHSAVISVDEEEQQAEESQGKRRKALNEIKQRRAEDEAVLGIFIHKSSLANSLESTVNSVGEEEGGEGGEEDASDDDGAVADAGGAEEDVVVRADLIEKRYRVGRSVPVARAVGYHLVEGLVLASNLPDSIRNEVCHWSQLHPGQVVEAVVSKIKDVGLVVKINNKVRALCPLLHLSDIVASGTGLKQLQKKFKVGQKLKVRVWEQKEGSIIVTHKKSLVEDKGELLVDFESAQVGWAGNGVVSRVAEEGLRVHFFNGVKGFIPARILGKQGVAEASESFRVGQLVRSVLIRKLDSAEADSTGQSKKARSLLLALELGHASDVLALLRDELSDASDDSGSKAMDVAGADSSFVFVSGVVTSVDADGVKVALDDGRHGKLHKHQCFDQSKAAEAVFSELPAFRVGARVESALVLEVYKGVVRLSLKPLLLSAARSAQSAEVLKLPSRASDLSAGDVVVGYVYKVESFGVLVRFRDELTALAPRANVTDKFVSTPEGLFQVGDSIRCMVQRVDMSRERVIISFRSSIVPSSLGDISFSRVLQREQLLVAEVSAARETSTLPDWRAFRIGSVTTASVVAVKPYGVVLVAGDQVTMLLASDLHAAKKVSAGQSFAVRVLDIDYIARVIQVSMLPDLVASSSSAITEHKSKKSKKPVDSYQSTLSLGAKIDVRVELVKEKYLIASVDSGRELVCVEIADYHCPYLETSEFTVHQQLTCRVVRLTSDGGLSFPHESLAVLSVYVDVIASKAPVGSASSDEPNGSPAELRSALFHSLQVGKIMRWTIQSILATEVVVRPLHFEHMGITTSGTIHVSNAIDQDDGFDDLSEALQRVTGLKDRESIHENHPFFGLDVGAVLSAKILHVKVQSSPEEVGSKKKRPRSNSKGDLEDGNEIEVELNRTSLVLSILPRNASELSGANVGTKWGRLIQWQGQNAVKKNSLYASVITKVDSTSCIVHISPLVSAKLHYLDVTGEKPLLKRFVKNCFVGQRLIVAVTDISQQPNSKFKHLTVSRVCVEQYLGGASAFSLATSSHITIQASPKLKKGATVFGIVESKSAMRPPAIVVALSGGQHGRVCATEVADKDAWVDHSSSQTLGRREGEVVKCRILSVDENKIELSLRDSRLKCKNKAEATTADPRPSEGDIVQGFVANVSMKGCFVRLSSTLSAIVYIKDLSDEFVENPVTSFPVGRLVEGRVLSVDQTSGSIRLTLKASAIRGDAKKQAELSALSVGDNVVGTVQRIADFGVFVALENTSLVGLSRSNDAISSKVKTLHDAFEVGDIVQAKVLSVSTSSGKIGLGLKPSFFRGEGADSDDDGDDGSGQDGEDVADEYDEEGADSEDNYGEGDGDGEDSDEEIAAMIKAASLPIEGSDSDDGEEPPSRSNTKSSKAVPQADDDSESDEDTARKGSIFSRSMATTAASAAFHWEDFKPAATLNSLTAGLAVDSDDSDSEEEGKGKGGAAKRSKGSAKKREEEDISARENALAAGSHLPTSPADFERLLMSSPNNSYVWIQYMAFHLRSIDVDAARAIAERGLKTINFREEDEKYNVWMALLNLEYKYGDSQTLETVLRRAMAESKGKVIHLHLAQIFESAGDASGAQGMFERALKKYKYSKKVWSAYQAFTLRQGDVTKAKQLLARSMQSLAKHKHVEVILKFAMVEYESGSVDRGRVVMEELVSSYPKRTDLWHVYVDKEIKLGNIAYARNLFERMITTKTSTQNMKTIFKKFLAFEVTFGTPSQQNSVRDRARDYVNSMIFMSQDQILKIAIRPMEDGWVMSEDWIIDVSYLMTIRELMQYIQKHKGISEHRQQIRMMDGKIVVPNKENWGLRRFAITDGYIIVVEPTLKGCWIWNEYDYYVRKLAAEIRVILDSNGGTMELSQLSKKIACPPPIKMSLRVYLRTYPDLFYLHTDLISYSIMVMEPQFKCQVPTFSSIPVQLGSMPIFQPQEFDWEGVADIDDTKKIEVEFEIPDICFEIGVVSAANIFKPERLQNANPFCVVYFNDKKLGRTQVRYATQDPVWREEAMKIEINASVELRDCKVVVEVWNMDLDAEEAFTPKGPMLGCVELTGQDVDSLVGSGRNTEMTFNLKSKRATTQHGSRHSTAALAASIPDRGTVTLRGGPGGYEIHLYAVRRLNDIPYPTCKPFVVLYWNNDEFGCTLPARTNPRDPLFDEYFPVPKLSRNRSLEQSTLEMQVWTSEPDQPEGSRDVFLGACILQKEKLSQFLTGNSIFRNRYRKDLQKSTFKVPAKQRKTVPSGVLVAFGGRSGLTPFMGRRLEILVKDASKLAKIKNAYVTVEWNSLVQGGEQYSKPVVAVDDVMTAQFNQTFFIETDNMIPDFSKNLLRVEMWEFNPTSRAGQAYLGQALLEKEEIVSLLGGSYAVERTIFLDRNPFKPNKEQALVRGQINIRAGGIGARTESERLLLIRGSTRLTTSDLGVTRWTGGVEGGGFAQKIAMLAQSLKLNFSGGGGKSLSSKDLNGSKRALSPIPQDVDGDLVGDEISGRVVAPIVVEQGGTFAAGSVQAADFASGEGKEESGVIKSRVSSVDAARGRRDSTDNSRDNSRGRRDSMTPGPFLGLGRKSSQASTGGSAVLPPATDVYVVVKWNGVEAGRTNSVTRGDLCVWDHLFYLTIPTIDPEKADKTPPTKFSLEVWEYKTEDANETRRKEVFLGGVYLQGEEINQFLESEEPVSTQLPLVVVNKKGIVSPAGDGELLVRTPGMKFASFEELRVFEEEKIYEKQRVHEAEVEAALARVREIEEEKQVRLQELAAAQAEQDLLNDQMKILEELEREEEEQKLKAESSDEMDEGAGEIDGLGGDDGAREGAGEVVDDHIGVGEDAREGERDGLKSQRVEEEEEEDKGAEEDDANVTPNQSRPEAVEISADDIGEVDEGEDGQQEDLKESNQRILDQVLVSPAIPDSKDEKNEDEVSVLSDGFEK